VIYAFISSALLQVAISSYIYRTCFNPVLYFNVLFFLHNWSYSFGVFLYPESYISWRADPSVSYETQVIVLWTNLASLWALFVSFIVFSRVKVKSRRRVYYWFRNLSILPVLYFIFTAILFWKSYNSGELFTVYGLNQASTASEAFSPILQLMGLRVVFGSTYLILGKNKNRGVVGLIFLVEIIFSLFEGGRKVLMILVFSLLIPVIENNRFTVVKAMRFSLASVFILYVLLLVASYRGTDRGASPISRVSAANATIVEGSHIIVFTVVNLANSEGVQNWTYQLIENKQMDLSLGKSYFQAAINTVLLRPFQGPIVDWQAAYVFKYAAYPNQHNQGWDFSFTAESMLNWGVRFSFLSYIVLGCIIAWLYRKKHTSQFYCLLYYAIWPILFIGFRTDSTAIFRTVSLYLIAVFICSIDFRNLKLSFKKR
jgi:hypothetical protein